MPRIQAATVKAHHDIVLGQLVDAAEQILRVKDAELTAAAVSKAAGIARNSIYRYVDSVDDLCGLVVAKHLPQWLGQVDAALVNVHDPAERLVVWTTTNLEQASATGHGWLVQLARTIPLAQRTHDAVQSAHRDMESVARESWMSIAPEKALILTEISRGLLEAGFRRIDAGDDPSLVINTIESAIKALIEDNS